TGNSAGDFQETTIESQVEELRLIIGALVKDRFTELTQIGLVAHAFGASVVIAAQPIEMIRSLLLISPMAKPFVTISKMYKRQWNFKPDEISKVERPNKEITKIGPQFWKSTQNTRLVAKSRQIIQPTLLIHAQKDYKVKNTDISEYFSAIISPKKLHIIEKADHGFSGKYRTKLMELTDEWFEETLRTQ
ncbi:alpha/beta hydrolase, partial [Candidatus Microgenomates bacterium]